MVVGWPFVHSLVDLIDQIHRDLDGHSAKNVARLLITNFSKKYFINPYCVRGSPTYAWANPDPSLCPSTIELQDWKRLFTKYFIFRKRASLFICPFNIAQMRFMTGCHFVGAVKIIFITFSVRPNRSEFH